MESEKVKEIKKALECCSILMDNNATSEEQDNSCNECPYRLNDRCSWKLDSDALTLINELETSESESCHELDNAFGQIHSLEEHIAEMEEDKEKWKRKAINYYQMVKSYGIECIIDNDIDETLKEFIK